jgi:hypothetical protein
MNSEVQFILSLCIGFTVVIGVIRFTTIDESYYPFFYLASISLLVEISTFILAKNSMYNVISVIINIFDYLEFFFLTWLFHLWGLFNFKRNIFLFIINIFFICWVIFTFYIGKITAYNLYFPIIYIMALLFFTVTTFNKFVIPDRGAIFKNPKFWILIGIIIFFAFYLLTTSTSMSIFGKNISGTFRKDLYGIVVYSNLIVNLMFAIGALCIPRKKDFTKLF